jgi:hypothetical protein
MDTCNECVYCKDKTQTKGKCKYKSPEIVRVYGSHRINILDGWPDVMLNFTSCGKFKKIKNN